MTNSRWRRLALLAIAGLWATAAGADTAPVHVEEMTWTEVRERLAAGATTVIVPVGGTEQNGPHMVLGKHNVRVRALAGQIAGRLGDTLVAPVMAYVPEGTIDPPQAHMRYAGTISIPDATFESVLEATARSFRQHGFRTVVLIGDHGGYQRSLERVAQRLDRAWAPIRPRTRVMAGTVFYTSAQQPFNALLAARGHTKAAIGEHAGLADTALAMAVDPALVRIDRLPGLVPDADGIRGDARRASAELGQLGVALVVERTVQAIRSFRGSTSSTAVAR